MQLAERSEKMNDERLKKTADVARQSRAATDRTVTENREISDDDRVEMFRSQFFQDALPDLPKLPSYHTCWLTTTNPRDSIQQRIRLGYEPIKSEDVPGWEYVTIKTGEWQGFIGVNEMLAFKLPMSLYHRYMNEAHHDAPAREDEKLTAVLDSIKESAEAAGGRIVEGDGISSLREHAGRRSSFEDL
jgi:hypothetical protein